MSEIDPAKIAVQVAIACTRALDQRCPEIGATFVKIGDAHAFFTVPPHYQTSLLRRDVSVRLREKT